MMVSFQPHSITSSSRTALLIVLLSFVASVPAFSAVETNRFQLNGDWCFVKRTEAAKNRAVVIIHGNGEVVESNGSSWEKGPDQNRLIELLTGAGFIVAQSNAAAIAGNGMWGNSDTQRAVLALLEHLRSVEHASRIDAVAISAGNLTLLNLMLRGTSFEHVVMLAPVTSLESLYRCPGGVDRVRQISRAFGFNPAGGCPGDPAHDEGFRLTTAGNDPGTVDQFTDEQVRVLRKARWMAVYEENDPKVPPPQNALRWNARLAGAGIKVVSNLVKGGRAHTSTALFAQCIAELISFLE